MFQGPLKNLFVPPHIFGAIRGFSLPPKSISHKAIKPQRSSVAQGANHYINFRRAIHLLHSDSEMDTSSPSAFVNGSLMRRYIGQKVRTVIQVVGSDIGSVVGKSTDDLQIFVKGSPPSAPTTYIEVIGIAENENSIRAEVWTNFGNSFDPSNYNELCKLANGEFKHLFI